MKTKLIALCIAILASVSMFAQSIFFEQDIRFFNNSAVPFTQGQWDQKVSGGLSMGPYIATSLGWNEAFWVVNYTTGNFAFGLGTGVEQLTNWSFRVSPWAQYTHPLGEKNSLKLFSLWEIGKGTGNYWYTNSLTYETPKWSVGALGRRTYGFGPIAGYKIGIGSWNLKISAATPYDFEDTTLKPTIILTVTN
jgi:hypothetical protein